MRGPVLYNASNQRPGVNAVKCIKLTYTGSLGADVKLYTPSTVNASVQYLNLTIEKGTSNPTYSRDDDGTSIDANSWARVDDVPATSTADFVKQTTANGTGYVEFTFADTAETCINAVGAVAAYHSSASGTNVGKISVFNGTTESMVYSGSMGVTTLGCKRAVVSAGSGAGTSSLVNALEARVGYSTDSSPNPYWDALLREYDVPLNW